MKMAAAAEGAGLAAAAAAEATPPAAVNKPGQVVRLIHPTKPGQCLARAPSRRVVSWAASNAANNKNQKWLKNPLGDDAGMTFFQLYDSGEIMTIGHVASLLPDPDFFHPRVLGLPARWKIKKDEVGDAALLGGVCLNNVMQNFKLEVKIAPWQEVNDEAMTASARRPKGSGNGCFGRLFPCF